MKWIEIMDCYGEFLSSILCSWNADHSTHTHKPSINGENVNNMHQMILLMQKCYKSTTNNPYFCMRLNCKKWKKWKVPLWRLRTKRKPNVQFNSIQSQPKRTSKCFVINVECRFILLSFRILGFHSLFFPRRSLWFDEIIFRALAYEKTHSHTICTFPSDTHWLAGLIERTFFFHFFPLSMKCRFWRKSLSIFRNSNSVRIWIWREKKNAIHHVQFSWRYWKKPAGDSFHKWINGKS